jgi:hypothetical protein
MPPCSTDVRSYRRAMCDLVPRVRARRNGAFGPRESAEYRHFPRLFCRFSPSFSESFPASAQIWANATPKGAGATPKWRRRAEAHPMGAQCDGVVLWPRSIARTRTEPTTGISAPRRCRQLSWGAPRMLRRIKQTARATEDDRELAWWWQHVDPPIHRALGEADCGDPGAAMAEADVRSRASRTRFFSPLTIERASEARVVLDQQNPADHGSSTDLASSHVTASATYRSQAQPTGSEKPRRRA